MTITDDNFIIISILMIHFMQISKCDTCKGIIKNNKVSVAVKTPELIYKNFDFCWKCGELIIEFLEEKKLLTKPAKRK